MWPCLLAMLLAGCSAMCVCTDDHAMRSGRVSVFAARVGADADDFLQACREACAR